MEFAPEVLPDKPMAGLRIALILGACACVCACACFRALLSMRCPCVLLVLLTVVEAAPPKRGAVAGPRWRDAGRSGTTRTRFASLSAFNEAYFSLIRAVASSRASRSSSIFSYID